MTNLRELFLLEPEITYLNHGAFGACPRPVYEAWQQRQRRMESNPTRYFQREFPNELIEARAVLAQTVNAQPDDVVFVPNSTYACNVITGSLKIGPGDELLVCTQEYGACLHALRYQAERKGFTIREVDLWMPTATPAEWAAAFMAEATERTKAIFISHITSATARVLPVAEVCRLAREHPAGPIATFIDGAHALGQLDLDLEAIGADAYFANAHKWLCAPKTVAILHLHPRFQAQVQPLVVGWGWGPTAKSWAATPLQDLHAWLGTLDYASWLTVPDAIRFQAEHDWPAVRERCRQLAAAALVDAEAVTGMAPHVVPGSHAHAQMVCLPLPPDIDVEVMQRELNQTHRIEAPFMRFRDLRFLRISVQGYNDRADIDRLLHALGALLA